MQLHFLISSEQRASGAMFMDTLNETVLAFIYPTDGTRTFHTFFCPPMRIVALSADGQVLFEELIVKWKWVRLPVCRYVIETGPKVDYPLRLTCRSWAQWIQTLAWMVWCSRYWRKPSRISAASAMPIVEKSDLTSNAGSSKSGSAGRS